MLAPGAPADPVGMAARRDIRMALGAALGALVLAPAAGAQTPGTGGTPVTPPATTPAPATAAIVGTRAVAPVSVPLRVRHVMTAANRLVAKPYRWGGGHRAFSSRLDPGYDCSGSVSYALYGGRFLAYPEDSTGLAKWGRPGPGRWITVYANKDHAYVVVAGLRFDTGMHDPGPAPTGTGPRWSLMPRAPKGFTARHPVGF
jgi:hypothetical protein